MTGDTLCLAPGVAPEDLHVRHSEDRQYLLIYLGCELVAMYGPMGSDIAALEFADSGCYSIEELLDRIPAGRGV